MPRETELKPMYQCGECSILFLKFDTIGVALKVYEICPNCQGPRNLCAEILDDAVLWYYMHIIAESNIPWQRRKNLRHIAETQMGPWNPLYRLL